MGKGTVFILLAILLIAPNVWAKRIVIAFDATWPPMEFLDANNDIIGFDPDFMNAAAKEAGFEVELKNVAWDGIFAGLDAGKYDAVCSSVTITENRRAVMDFTVPYFKVFQALVVPKDSPAKSIEDLKGKTLGGQVGTTGYFAIQKVDGVNAKPYNEIGLAMEDLLDGRIDGVVCDDPVAAQYALQKAEYSARFKISAVLPTGDEFYGVAVKKGNKEVVDLLNKGIEAVQAKGIDKQLRQKWMGP
jgi:polar amino acid transport system substrate-binding protein